MKLRTSKQLSFCADQWGSITAIIHFKINFEDDILCALAMYSFIWDSLIHNSVFRPFLIRNWRSSVFQFSNCLFYISFRAMNFKFLSIFIDVSGIPDRLWMRDKNITKNIPIQCTSLYLFYLSDPSIKKRKKGMPDSHRYSANLYLLNFWEDIKSFE